MASTTIQIRERRKNTAGDYDVIHRETKGNLVLLNNGSTAEDHLTSPDAHMDIRADIDNLEGHVNTLLPTAVILSFTITPDDYFGAWELLLCAGGIHAPLEVWGFTNAVLTPIPNKTVIDINTNTATIYTIPEFAGMTWNVHQYQSGVYILTALDKALIFIRR